MRRFVGDLCLRVLEDADVTARVVVAAHELYDNALRHAPAGESRLRAEVMRSGPEEGTVLLATTNTVAGDREDVLRAVLAEVATATDRAAFYQSLLRRVARRGPSEAPVGLGIGRVHAEAELLVSGSIVEGVVTIEARGRFPLRVAR